MDAKIEAIRNLIAEASDLLGEIRHRNEFGTKDEVERLAARMGDVLDNAFGFTEEA